VLQAGQRCFCGLVRYHANGNELKFTEYRVVGITWEDWV
jgi:hypothetical protein